MQNKLRNILIVEDDAMDAQLSERALKPIMEAFPGASVSIVSSLDLARDIARTQIPPPLLAIIDPGLPDMEKTIEHLHEFEDKMPVVILTGRQPEEVASRVDHAIQIVNKNDALKSPSLLHSAIATAYALFHGNAFGEQWDRIAKLKEIANGGQ